MPGVQQPSYNAPDYGATQPLDDIYFPTKSKLDVNSWFLQRPGLWPTLLTLIILTLMAPAFVCAFLVMTDSVAYFWVHMAPKAVLVTPGVVIACHFLHAIAGRPRFYPLCCSTLIPSIVMIVVGFVIMNRAAVTGHRMLTSDCKQMIDTGSVPNPGDYSLGYDSGTKLEDAWRHAYTIFHNCADRVAIKTGKTFSDTVNKFDIRDCNEYIYTDLAKSLSEQWKLLGAVETNLACTGWCTPGSPALWTKYHEQTDICSVVVGNHLIVKISSLGTRILIIGVVTFFLGSAFLYLVYQEMLRRKIDW